MIKLKPLVEEKSFTLRDIQREANKYGLTLRKGKGYYYWDIDERANKKLGKKAITDAWYALYTTNVDVAHWEQLPWDYWMRELKDILKSYEKEKKEYDVYNKKDGIKFKWK